MKHGGDPTRPFQVTDGSGIGSAGSYDYFLFLTRWGSCAEYGQCTVGSKNGWFLAKIGLGLKNPFWPHQYTAWCFLGVLEKIYQKLFLAKKWDIIPESKPQQLGVGSRRDRCQHGCRPILVIIIYHILIYDIYINIWYILLCSPREIAF